MLSQLYCMPYKKIIKNFFQYVYLRGEDKKLHQHKVLYQLALDRDNEQLSEVFPV